MKPTYHIGLDVHAKTVAIAESNGNLEFYGNSSASNLSAERVNGYVMIGKLANKTRRLIQQHRERFRTITADKGCEFHGYRKIEARTGVVFYFANPHHSWERGTNESTNGLSRQYLPKGANRRQTERASA